MKRTNAIEIKATRSELRVALLQAFATEQNMTITALRYDDKEDTVIINGIEGVSARQSPIIGEEVVELTVGVQPKKRVRNAGLGEFIKTLFSGGEQWPLDKLLKACKDSGYELTLPYLRNVVLSQHRMTEVHPNIFQKPSIQTLDENTIAV